MPAPALAISTTFCPAGLTSSICTSEGCGCVKPKIFTDTLLIAPSKPETGMVAGYGVPVPESGMVTALAVL